jgi:predicted O-methyltransferase YrrM
LTHTGSITATGCRSTLTTSRSRAVNPESPSVAAVLERLLAQSAAQDPAAKQRVAAREAQLGERLDQESRYELYGQAPLAITREVGELLYVLTLSRPPGLVLEFGASLGLSTIFLAAAIRDGAGTGSLITTEIDPEKAAATQRNLTQAGLEDLVELRRGDALQTLADLPRPVDLLFLDGRNDLYLPVLNTVQEHLAAGALVAGDLNREDPDLLPYLQYVRDPDNDYRSIEIPLHDGVELSVRITA